jgi:hypothetical protein
MRTRIFSPLGDKERFSHKVQGRFRVFQFDGKAGGLQRGDGSESGPHGGVELYFILGRGYKTASAQALAETG